jgi:hypothetical protein
MPASTRINYPKCGYEFNVEDVLAQQIKEIGASDNILELPEMNLKYYK